MIDYPEPQRSEILDYLFLPNFGASLQVLKVEIGGDSQSTDGTEPSHMHTGDRVELHSGYEWWLMVEAKKRNKDIKLYGLPWAFPGWVGIDPSTKVQSHSPFKYPKQTIRYILEWLKGARHEYGLEIDYLGVWNERGCDPQYVILLRQAMDLNGFNATQLVVKDGDMMVCDDLHKNSAYAQAVDVIGLHYPSDYTTFLGRSCSTLGKPVWSAEESSSYDDVNGAACWARVMNSHFVLSNMTSSLMWNLVGAYYHGLNWYASSMLTAVEPWSGHYGTFPVLWTTAHVTQFTKVGWNYLPVGSGSGKLPKGGFYTTIVDPAGTDFTIQVVKVSHDHARCTRPPLPKPAHPTEDETIRIRLHPAQFGVSAGVDPIGVKDVTVDIWKSNFESDDAFFFHKQKRLTVSLSSPEIVLQVRKGDYYTISTVKTARRGSHAAPIPKSSPQFPLPYTDDFQSYDDASEAKYLADQIGSFEIHSSKGEKVLRQMVPTDPVAWVGNGDKGPMTVTGMVEWQDVSVSVLFKVDRKIAAGCVGTRVDMMWTNGIVVCVDPSGGWNLTIGGPAVKGQPNLLLHGTTEAFPLHTWQKLKITTAKAHASAWFNGKKLFSHPIRDNDVGFAVFGTNGWFPIEFRDLSISKAADGRWTPPQKPNRLAKAGDRLVAVDCQPNGLIAYDQDFDLLSSWLIRHNPSNLCVSASAIKSLAELRLQECNSSDPRQQFRNDYTRVRNEIVPLWLGETRDLLLAGNLDGKAQVVAKHTKGYWIKWAYYPNSRSLRNQYGPVEALGYPKCLSTGSSTRSTTLTGVSLMETQLMPLKLTYCAYHIQHMLCPLVMISLLFVVTTRLRSGRHSRIRASSATSYRLASG